MIDVSFYFPEYRDLLALTQVTFQSMYYLLAFFSLIIGGCAGLNPNPGERTSDIALLDGKYQRALKIIQPKANAGYPWAQLRLGMMYEHGYGLEKDIDKALEWYQKAAIHLDDSNWGLGFIIGAYGTAGYFNQNSDALIARYYLASIYFEQNNLLEAKRLIQSAIEKNGQKDIFFCCEFDRGAWFTAQTINNLNQKINQEILARQSM